MEIKKIVNSMPSVLFTPSAYIDINLYVKMFPLEISGTGKILVTDNNIIVEEIIILPQIAADDCSKTILTKEGYAEFYEQLHYSGQSAENYKLWWHSHPYSKKLAWSPDDENNIILQENSTRDFYLNILLNKHKTIRARIDFFNPHRTIDHLLTGLTETISPAAMEQAARQRLPFIVQNIKINARIAQCDRNEKKGK